MRAFSTVGGGVMFIPDQIERKGVTSYRQLLNEEKAATPQKKLFGKRRAGKKETRKAA